MELKINRLKYLDNFLLKRKDAEASHHVKVIRNSFCIEYCLILMTLSFDRGKIINRKVLKLFFLSWTWHISVNTKPLFVGVCQGFPNSGSSLFIDPFEIIYFVIEPAEITTFKTNLFGLLLFGKSTKSSILNIIVL